MLVILLLLILACVAVRPRTKGVLYATTGGLGLLVLALVALMALGYVHWDWQAPR